MQRRTLNITISDSERTASSCDGVAHLPEWLVKVVDLRGATLSGRIAERATACCQEPLLALDHVGFLPAKPLAFETHLPEPLLKVSWIGSFLVRSSSSTWRGGEAEEAIPGSIIEQQSTKVDAVTGATISSTAIMNAVQDAVEKATN